MRRYFPELLALPLYPLLSWQGKRTRRITPRLPEAAGPSTGKARPKDLASRGELRLLTVGESPVAGVGVATHEQAITGQLARALADKHGIDVAWQALGRNGADLTQALQSLVPLLPHSPGASSADLVLVAFGVNDTTAFRSCSRYRQELQELLLKIQKTVMPRQIILSGVAPVHAFPALPQPLRFVLGSKARALDEVTNELASGMSAVHYVSMKLDTGDATLMASDGYHPSEKGAKAWAKHLVDRIGDIYVEIAE